MNVDALDPETREARIHGLGDHAGRQIGASTAYPVAAARSGDLRHHDESVAPVPREPVPDERLGASLRRRVRRHRIHLGRVDDVDALRERVVELGVRLAFGVLLAEGHRAETHVGDLELGAGQLAVSHRIACPTER